jgi:hypothetical protein
MGGILGRTSAWLCMSGAIGLAVGLGFHTAEAFAQSEPAGPRNELFTGFEASDNYASGYLGGGYAFGKGLYQPGWRLRSVGAYGRYHYDGTLLSGGDYVPTRFEGEDYFGSVLAGYQFHPGGVIVKLFAGVESDSQVIHPHDPNNAVQGSRFGLRLQAEGWYDISPSLYLSADASYGTAFQSYCSLARLGYRVWPKLSLGIEGGALGNEEYDAGRGGGFLRVDFRLIEVTLSGGFTGNYLEDDPSGYVSLGVYRNF